MKNSPLRRFFPYACSGFLQDFSLKTSLASLMTIAGFASNLNGESVLFWSNQFTPTGALISGLTDGTNGPADFIDGDDPMSTFFSPDGLAQQGDFLYFVGTSTGREALMRTAAQGPASSRAVTTIFRSNLNPGVATFQGLAASPTHLFYTTQPGSAIYRSEIDGTPSPGETDSNGNPLLVPFVNPTTALSLPGASPLGLATSSTRLYWSDPNSDGIFSTLLDGTDPQMVLNTASVGSTSPTGLAYYNSQLFWTDPEVNAIYRVNIDGANAVQLVDLETTFGAEDDFSTWAPRGIAAGAEGVFWAETQWNGFPNGSGIYRCNIDGSAPTFHFNSFQTTWVTLANFDPPTLNLTASPVSDGFESGDLSAFPWFVSPVFRFWEVGDSFAGATGNYALSSPSAPWAVYHESEARLALKVATPANQPVRLTYKYSISTEFGSDYFIILLNGIQVKSYSGTSGFLQDSVILEPDTTYQIDFVYRKDDNFEIAGDDRFLLDEVAFIPFADEDGDGLDDALEQMVIDADPSDNINTLVDVAPGDDFDGDGITNLEEQLAGTSLIVGPIRAAGAPIDGFETGDFTAAPWTQSGEDLWVITTTAPFEGSFSAESPAGLPDDGSATLSLPVSLAYEATLHLAYRVSSEQDYDFFSVDAYDATDTFVTGYMDSGETPWREIEIDLPSSVVRIDFTYYKDSSASEGSDSAAIDLVRFTYVDTDNDSLPDGFEQTIIDANPDDAVVTLADVGAMTDFDGDGETDAKEYVGGYSPIDKESHLIVNLVVQQGATVTITWNSAAGRSYRIRKSNGSPGNMFILADKLPATTPENQYVDQFNNQTRKGFYTVEPFITP